MERSTQWDAVSDQDRQRPRTRIEEVDRLEQEDTEEEEVCRMPQGGFTNETLTAKEVPPRASLSGVSWLLSLPERKIPSPHQDTYVG